MASYLYRQTTVPTSEKKFTISTWMKISADTSVEKGIIEWYRSSSDRYQVLIDTTGKMRIHSQVGGSTGINIYTDMLFRDPASWYHIVIHNDTAESSATDRFKLWVNGEAQTFSTYSYTYNGSNINCFDGTSGDAVNVGVRDETSSKFFDGSLADTYYVDGSLIAYTQFGQTDSTSGIWKPNLSPTISSFGNAGFRLKYENSGNLGLDSSGNSLNMTASGTVTQTQDTPSNNFTTWNINMNNAEDGIWHNANLTIAPNGDDTYLYAPITFGLSAGKWYSEHMITGGNGYGMLGAISEDNIVDGFRQQTGMGSLSNSFAFRCRDGDIRMSSSNQSYGSSPGTSDAILGMALDMDNKKVWYHINGTYVTYGGGVGNPASGTYGWDFSSLSGDTFLITCGDDTSSGYGNFKSNFGSGYFGTTAVTSSNADGAGFGLFEYSVPSGFYSICTKNIKDYG